MRFLSWLFSIESVRTTRYWSNSLSRLKTALRTHRGQTPLESAVLSLFLAVALASGVQNMRSSVENTMLSLPLTGGQTETSSTPIDQDSGDEEYALEMDLHP